MKARLNPFRSETVEAFRYQLDPNVWRDIEARFHQSNHLGSVVGPHGTGKTVFLEDFALRLKQQGWTPHFLRFHAPFTREDRSQLQNHFQDLSSSPSILLLDGGELIPRRDWRQLLRRIKPGQGLLATLHRQGRLPVLWETKPQLEIALRLVGHLLDRPLQSEETEVLEARFQKFEGNIRDVIRSFYLDSAQRKHGMECRLTVE